MTRISESAFEYYVSLGEGRSYGNVAGHFGVSKRAIVKHAKRHRWAERLSKIEEAAQERVDQKLVESIEETRLRHFKILRAMASRAVKAIQEYPLTSGMEGIRAAETVIKLERLLQGQPTERTAADVEAVVRREFEAFMVADEETPSTVGRRVDAGEHEDDCDDDGEAQAE